MAATGLIFDVQRFSIHDGPGIRTTVFFKGCPLRCHWCQNPEGLLPRPELALFADRCRASFDCMARCPRDALHPAGYRTAGIHIDRAHCDACALCIDACAWHALEIVGRQVTVDELLEEVSRDLPYFQASGGGVTLSGGEPTQQLEFVGPFAAACRERGIPVGMQTCGAFRWDALEPFLPLFAFIHFDLKVMDPLEHRRLTGADNRLILENARRFRAAGAPVLFRMPIIPNHTDGQTNLRQIAAFLLELGVSRIHLLCYHKLGEDKLARLESPLRPLGLEGARQARESLDQAREILNGEGLEVTL